MLLTLNYANGLGPILRQIGKACELTLERQHDGACGAVPLLADNDLRFAVRGCKIILPIQMLRGAMPRLLILQVIFFTKHEQNNVRILLDRA